MQAQTHPNDDYTTDSCHQFVEQNLEAIQKVGGLVSVEEIEALPGKYKKYKLLYPCIEIRQMAIRAPNLQAALRQAHKKVEKWHKAYSANQYGIYEQHKRRAGDFAVETITVSNFKDKLSRWGSNIFNATFMRWNNSWTRTKKDLSTEHCSFELPVHKDLVIPDSYFLGE